MGRVILAYVLVCVAVHYFDNRFTVPARDVVDALGIMLGIPAISLWLQEWLDTDLTQ